MDRCCRVIACCFIDGRSDRNNSPPTSEACLNFLKRVVDKEIELKTDINYDLILVNHNVDYELGNEYITQMDNVDTGRGIIRTITTDNKRISMDAYNTAFKHFMDDYDFWLFSEDDHLIFRDNYYTELVKEFKGHGPDIGFLALAPISKIYPATHSGGGYGLTTTEVLKKVLELNNNMLPCLETHDGQTQTEIMFTNYIIQVGYELVTTKKFSYYPINHALVADHTVHRHNQIWTDTLNYLYQVGPHGEGW